MARSVLQRRCGRRSVTTWAAACGHQPPREKERARQSFWLKNHTSSLVPLPSSPLPYPRNSPSYLGDVDLVQGRAQIPIARRPERERLEGLGLGHLRPNRHHHAPRGWRFPPSHLSPSCRARRLHAGESEGASLQLRLFGPVVHRTLSFRWGLAIRLWWWRWSW